MSSVIHCEGPIVQASYGGDVLDGVVACPSGWIISPYESSTGTSQDELLTAAIQSHQMSREDFFTLSVGCVAILLVAMGLRVILKMFFSSGVFTNEKN